MKKEKFSSGKTIVLPAGDFGKGKGISKIKKGEELSIQGGGQKKEELTLLKKRGAK